MKLTSLSVNNFRCISNHIPLSLKPLTFIVGANSSGKSTFLRLFPLLRQSVETVTKGPILWFGRFVDFGVFEDALSRKAGTKEIEFKFTINISKNLDFDNFTSYMRPPLPVLDDISVSVCLTVSKDPETSNAYTKKLSFILENREVSLEVMPDGLVKSFCIDNIEIKNDTVDFFVSSKNSLFSINVRYRKSTNAKISVAGDLFNNVDQGGFHDQVVEHINRLFHGKTHKIKKDHVAWRLGIGNVKSLFSQLKALADITPFTAEKVTHENPDSQWMKTLQGLVLANKAPLILNEIGSFLSNIFRGVNYIGPLRATAERFYRHQDLAVDEVDPQGSNLAMFLMGLSAREQKAFQEWCSKNIGFNVIARSEGAHVSIYLEDNADGSVFNITDMGFGFSQLLPVLATIWRSLTAAPKQYVSRISNRRRFTNHPIDLDNIPRIIAVEQPELHLHPRLQGRLANLLCSIASNIRPPTSNVKIICETHSETMINYIGGLIADGVMSPENVQIMIFEKKEGEHHTAISISEYGKDGILENWPYGFFLPDAD